MRMGIFGGEVANAKGVDDTIAMAKQVRDDGFDAFWLPQIFGFDAMAVFGIIGREVDGLEFGTAVVPTYPRHPFVMAQQALTTNSLTDGRFVLGIGLSHQVVIEGMFGYSFDKPARHMREYLDVLLPLMNGETVSFKGETLSAQGALTTRNAPAPSVMIAALAPRMLELCGRKTDGTITWMTGPKTVESHIAPSLNDAAEKAGRPQPRIAVGLPVCVTDDIEGATARAAEVFTVYGYLPSYRAMLDREGAAGPADVAIIGTEDQIAEKIAVVEKSGCTDFFAVEIGGNPDEQARTRAALKSLL